MVKDLETSRLDMKQPNQVRDVYDRLVFFQVRLVCVCGLSKSGVQVLNHNRSASASRQDSYSIGQDGKCVQQAVETHNRMVTRWA